MRHRTWATLLICTAITLLAAPLALAGNGLPLSGSGGGGSWTPPPPSDPTNADQQYCSDMCGKLESIAAVAGGGSVDPDTGGITSGGSVSGNDIGGPQSLAWCTAHGAGFQNTSFTPAGTPSAAPSNPAGSCMINGREETGGESSSAACGQYANLINACGWLANSQLVNYCKAYEAVVGGNDNTGGSQTADEIMIATDVVVAGFCLTSCLSGGGTWACTVSAMGAGTAEMIEIMAQKHGEVAQYINAIGGGAGIALGGAQILVGEVARQANSKGEVAMACATSALFAVMAGVRVADLISMKHAADSSCSDIKNMAGANNAPAAGSGNGAGGTFAGAAPPGGTSGFGGGEGGSGSGGSTSASGSNSASNSAGFQTCMQGGGNPISCAQSNNIPVDQGAKDSQFLTRMPPLPPTNFNGILDKLHNGASAGDILRSGLPSAAGNAGNALAGLADFAQKNPDLGSSLGVQSSVPESSYGGGGGGAKQASADAANPFASMFGDQGAAGPKGGNTTQKFGREPAGQNDIWHRNSKLTIFDIVSGRMYQVVNRMNIH